MPKPKPDLLSELDSIHLVRELQRRDPRIARGLPVGEELEAEPRSLLRSTDSRSIFRELEGRRVVARGTYGFDDRREITQVKLEEHVRAADSVAAVFESSRVRRLHDAFPRVRLETGIYGLRFELHESERFWDQPFGALGAAVLVAPDLVLTAAHLVSREPGDRRIVFGYRMVDRSTVQTELPTTEVYEIRRVVAMEKRPDLHRDWALCQLHRDVRNHEPARIRRNGPIATQTLVYSIGHPGGLPLKFCDGARVRVADEHWFTANLDHAVHSSGSPVFNADDHVVEGILYDGEDYPFVPYEGRWRVGYHLEDDQGLGAQCTRTTVLEEHVPR